VRPNAGKQIERLARFAVCPVAQINTAMQLAVCSKECKPGSNAPPWPSAAILKTEEDPAPQADFQETQVTVPNKIILTQV
jgi:hypothetical protein